MSRYMDSDKSGMERLRQHFADEVRSRFAFLSDLGFTEIEATLALVRFQNLNGDVEVGVYTSVNPTNLELRLPMEG